MAIHEGALVEDWLIDTLTNDATLKRALEGRVYKDIASQKAKPPYLVFNEQAGSDTDSAGARIMAELVMQIQVVSSPCCGASTIRTILDQLEALLQDRQVVFEEAGHKMRVKGAGLVPRYTEVAAGGVLYTHQGRFWRFRVGKI